MRCTAHKKALSQYRHQRDQHQNQQFVCLQNGGGGGGRHNSGIILKTLTDVTVGGND